MPTYNIPQNNVMQQSQESGYRPASRPNQMVPRTPSGNVVLNTPYTIHTLPSTSTPIPTPSWSRNTPRFPPSANGPIPTPPLFTNTPSFPPYNPNLPSNVPTPTPSWFHNTPSFPPYIPCLPSNVPIPTQPGFPNISSFPPYPHVPTAVRRPRPDSESESPSPPRKRGRKAAKAPLAPTGAPKTRQRRGEVRSQIWLDTYFINKMKCKLCGGGCTERRTDRLLEHLVSVHFIQVIKNVAVYDADRLRVDWSFHPHFIASEAAFQYTRRFVDAVKCSFCVNDNSLVFRAPRIHAHLETNHIKDATPAAREEEERRLKVLEPDKAEFYNIHDKFLYEFPGGVNSEVVGPRVA
ncbi:hypothetical protein Clacol_010189 [Clathrus columnatus]|uniref:BED-type domain-containing protein n=1 Tax=Clathrus columnatus TaxID=1419009 RepID=A0AAV5AT24_9AGAM|nr:hypothetical protein Clacol_010189 [Clathrus columnatus]